MSKNFFDVAHAHSKASNKNSAMAVSGGLSYSPSRDGDEIFDVPPPYFLKHELEGKFSKFIGKYGTRVFRLTVLGVYKDTPETNTTPIFVCKCSCGSFVLRRNKKLREGKFVSCGICSQNFQRIIDQKYAGNPTQAQSIEVWQRMGGA